MQQNSIKLIPKISEPFFKLEGMSYFIEEINDLEISLSVRKGDVTSSDYVASLQSNYAEPNSLQSHIYEAWVGLAKEYNCFLWVTKKFYCMDQSLTENLYVGLVIEMMACLQAYKQGCLARADGQEWKGRQIRKFCKLNGPVGIFMYENKKNK